MWVKICGNTSLDDARLATELGADALGFIFAPSRRRVTVAQAKSIIDALPASVEKVGVFTEGSAEDIGSVVHEAGLTAVQLHMPLQPELARALKAQFGERVRLLQVVSLQVDAADVDVELERFRSAVAEAVAQPELFALLLDAARGQTSGGLGVPIDWRAAARSLNAVRHKDLEEKQQAAPHIILAGGLRAENLREAIAALQPWGVDVVSGVEELPGIKSPLKMRAFLNEARSL